MLPLKEMAVKETTTFGVGGGDFVILKNYILSTLLNPNNFNRRKKHTIHV